MGKDILSEGTIVRIIRYDKRPEFNGKEAEIGNYSAKDNTYECWLTDDALEGCYALCAPDDFEHVAAKPEPEPPAPRQSAFSVGDRVRGKESGNLGTVTELDADGDPKVIMDGEDEALQRFGTEFEVVKDSFGIGDRVKGKESGQMGTVVAVDEDGDPKVKIDGEDEALQRFGKEFEVVEKAVRSFQPGDRVKGKETGKLGTVVSVDDDGDPKVKLDGEDEAQQRYGKEFTIVTGQEQSRSRSKSSKKDEKRRSQSRSGRKRNGKNYSRSRKRSRSRCSAIVVALQRRQTSNSAASAAQRF